MKKGQSVSDVSSDTIKRVDASVQGTVIRPTSFFVDITSRRRKYEDVSTFR